MEEVIDKEEEKEIIVQEKKYFRICGRTIWRIFAYFVIYSILGFCIETMFGLIKYGTLESRKSFLYGPFCAIYGVGAVIMVLSLHYFQKNYNTLFIGGCIVGSIIEYIVSWLGEIILHIKWWDYSNMPFNLNGRICASYAVFWGLLGVYLMMSLNPKIDKMINFIKERIKVELLQIFVVIFVIIMLIDCILTAYAVSYFVIRTIVEKDIKISKQEYIEKLYDKIYSNEKKKQLIEKYFNNEKMLMTFPRITVEDIEGNIINIRDLYPDIRTYYYKLKQAS